MKKGKAVTFTFFIPSMPEGFKNVGEAIAAAPEVAAASHDDSTAAFGGQGESDVVIMDEEDRNKVKPFCNKHSTGR
ncbi:hypothetical protein ABG775_27545 [Peribacillus simplex]